MRGTVNTQESMFVVLSLEDVVPADHPLRTIRSLLTPILQNLSPRFESLYSNTGRPSIAPEQLLLSLVVQTLYSIRSERLLIEEIGYSMLYRWFVGLTLEDKVWDHSVYTKNRDRLLDGQIAQEFMAEVVALARSKNLLSDEHFTVDGTLVEAWAGQKSFKKKETPSSSDDTGGNPTVNFHGEQRSNATHQSTTDPEARLMRKGSGKEARLSFMGHVLMENRNGLAVEVRYTLATGTAEREAAIAMSKKVQRKSMRTTLAADKNYDTHAFVHEVRSMNMTPHIAQRSRGSALDGRTTRHEGYVISQRKRKRVEEIFGWMKTVGHMRKIHFKGLDRGGWMFTFAAAVYNLVRIKNLTAIPAT